MDILFATTSLPHGQTTGGEIASQAFIDAMRAAGHDVTVFGFARDALPAPLNSISLGFRPIETASAGHWKFVWLGQSLLRRQPYVCEKFRARRYLDRLKGKARLRRADLLVLDHAQMGWLLPHARTLARAIVLIAHNHETPLYAAAAARETHPLRGWLLRRDSRLLGVLEPRLARAVDQVWTLSASEQSSFGAMSGSDKASLMPLAGRAFPPQDNTPKLFDIGLLGTWAWEVNGQGLDWFVDQVLPLLPAHVSVRVAGRGSERLHGRSSNLAAMGFVADPVAFMRAARVLAIPAIAGAGIQLKTIEAIASGTPTVSTSLGVRALPGLPHYVAVADTPAGFAAALLAQLSRKAPSGATAQAWSDERRTSFEHAVAAQLQRLGGLPRSRAVLTRNAEP